MMSRIGIIILTTMIASFESSAASSQFRNDASFSIVDNELNTTLLLYTSTASPSTLTSGSTFQSSSTSPTTSVSSSVSLSSSTSMSSSSTISSSSTVSPSSRVTMSRTVSVPTSTFSSTSSSSSTSFSPSSSTFSTSTSSPTTPTTSSTAATTPFTLANWFDSFNPLSGFDEPPPLLLRGDDGLNATSGVFHIVDDGFYIFMIHRGGVNGDNSSVDLVFLDDHDLSNTTLATVEDTGEGTVFSAHVAVELRRDDYILIANPTFSDVEGDMDNPFIYNAFLLYHKPLSSFPRVRQSAFTVTVAGNLTLADDPLTNYNSPAVDINGDFNIDRGTFLVPMRGIYVFHLDVTFVSPSLDVRSAVAITVNDAIRARVQARFDSPQLRKNAAVTIAQSLLQGDSVRLLNLLSTPDIDCHVVLTGYLLS